MYKRPTTRFNNPTYEAEWGRQREADWQKKDGFIRTSITQALTFEYLNDEFKKHIECGYLRASLTPHWEHGPSRLPQPSVCWIRPSWTVHRDRHRWHSENTMNIGFRSWRTKSILRIFWKNCRPLCESALTQVKSTHFDGGHFMLPPCITAILRKYRKAAKSRDHQ